MKSTIVPYLLAVSAFAVTNAYGGAAPNAGKKTESGTQTTSKGTNIIYILLDDQDATTSPIWEALPKTKARLKDKGLTFNNAFSPTPICCAARSSILTGLYGHNAGVLTNAGTYGGYGAFRAPHKPDGSPMTDSNGKQIDNENRTIAKHLSDSGYRTVLLGKYLNDYEEDPTHVPVGWSEWYGGASKSIYAGYKYTLAEYAGGTTRVAKAVEYGDADADYITDVVARKSVDFINRAKDSTNPDRAKPLFMYVSSTAPHLPLAPARRHAELAKKWKGKLPKSENYYEKDISDKPKWLTASGEKRSKWKAYNESEYPNRMGSLLAVDDMVEDIAKALEAKGELDKTVFVFTSDNGYNLGAHRLLHKMAPYEESVRVPLVIAGAGIPKGERTQMVLDIDTMPTILDLAGVSIPSNVDGKSWKPLFKSDPTSFRSDFLAQYAGSGNGTGVEQEMSKETVVAAGIGFTLDIPKYRAVHTGRHVLVEWYESKEFSSVHEYELYDLKTDPYQLTNLVKTKKGTEATPLFKELKARLEALATCTGTSCRP